MPVFHIFIYLCQTKIKVYCCCLCFFVYKAYEGADTQNSNLVYDAYYESITLPQSIYQQFKTVDKLYEYLKGYDEKMHIENHCLFLVKDKTPLVLLLADDNKKIVNNLQKLSETHHHIIPLAENLWDTLPYRAVVKIVTHYSKGKNYGSGVIVGRRNVLTVAHNLYERQKQEEPTLVELFVWEKQQLIKLQVKEWKVPQQYRTSNNTDVHSFDFATITLSNNVSQDRILQIQKNWNQQKGAFQQIGFSGILDQSHKTKTDTVFYLRCQRFIQLYHSYATYDLLAGSGISGGPFLVQKQGNFKVIGLHQGYQGQWSKVVLITEFIKNPVAILDQLNLFNQIKEFDKQIEIKSSQKDPNNVEKNQASAKINEQFKEKEIAKAKEYNEKGVELYQKAKYDEALEFHLKSLAIWKQVYGQNHASYATSLNNIGLVYDSKGELDKALEFHFKSLAIRKQVYGQNHPDYAVSLNNIGAVYRSKGELDKALEFCFKSLAIRKQVYGQNHPDYAASLNNIGTVYKRKGELDKALEFLLKSLAIRKQVYGQNHPSYKTVLQNTKWLQQKLKK